MNSYNRYEQEIFALVQDFDLLSSVDAIMEALKREAGRFGMQYLGMTGIDPMQPAADQCVASAWAPECKRVYESRGYLRFDPILRLARQTAKPFEWKETTYAHETDRRALEVMDTLAQFGVKQGFVVPVRCPGGYEAGVLFEGERIELPPLAKPALHSLATYAFNRVRELIGVVPAPQRMPVPVTEREREVMVWLATGHRPPVIADILNISEHTVRAHLQSAQRKLGAATTSQAVAIAVSGGIIARSGGFRT
jgi:LuxR family transcriptional regulator, quorum-sensing system regulator BjaR1